MFSLALMLLHRFSLSNQSKDLDKAIVNFTDSILLSPLSSLQHGTITLATLFLLASTLLLRSNVSKKPEDAICAIKYFTHLRDQPHEIPSIPRHQVTAFLVDALALQVELEAGNLSMAEPGEFMITSGSRPSGLTRTTRLNSLITGSIHEIDSTITQLQHLLAIFPRSDPRRPRCVFRIASQRVLRHQLSNQREDLDKAIVNLTELILLSPLSWLQCGQNILNALFPLACALFMR